MVVDSVPMLESSCPAWSSRKSRLRRSGTLLTKVNYRPSRVFRRMPRRLCTAWSFSPSFFAAQTKSPRTKRIVTRRKTPRKIAAAVSTALALQALSHRANLAHEARCPQSRLSVHGHPLQLPAIDDHVDRGDAAAGHGEAHDRERPFLRPDDDTGGAVDEGGPCVRREARAAREYLPSHRVGTDHGRGGNGPHRSPSA